MVEREVTPVSTMLKIAESWQKCGKLHQAIDMYFRLKEHFPETDEASESEERLLSLTQELTEKGKVYRAIGISERLLTPSRL